MVKKTVTKKSKVSSKSRSVKKAKPAMKKVKSLAKSAKKKVSAIPKNHHAITPYLIVDNAVKAINFYQKAFGAKLLFKTDHGKDKIGHAELRIGDSKIMLADEFPKMDVWSPRRYTGSPVSMLLYVKNVDMTVAKAVAHGAQVTREVQNLFYGDRSGMIVDPFGHKWNISTHVEDVTPKQLKKRVAAMLEMNEDTK